MTSLWLGVALTLLAAPEGNGRIGLLVVRSQEISAADRSFLTSTFASILEEETGRAVVLDDFAANAQDLFASTVDLDVVVSIGMTAGARLARIEATCTDRQGVLSTVRLDVPRGRSDWAPRLRGLVRALFPPSSNASSSAPSRAPPLAVEVAKPTPSTSAGWAAVASGAAVGLGAAVLRVFAEQQRQRAREAQDAHNAATTSELRERYSTEANAASDRSATLGLWSNLAFLTGAVLVTGGAVYLGTVE